LCYIYPPDHREGDPSEFTIYFVKHKQMYPLPGDEYGVFHTHNAYVLHYMLRIPGTETRHFVYFWLGRHASIVRLQALIIIPYSYN